MAPILGIIASSITGGLVTDAGAMFPIRSYVVPSGGAASIEWTSIPQTYSHLQIRGISRCAGTTTVSIDVQVNSDTSTNYSWHRLYGDGSSASAYAEPNSTKISELYQPINTDTANAFGSFVLDLLDYKDTNKYKTMRYLTAYDVNGANGKIAFASGNWRNTNAITSIKLTSNGGNFAQYSSFALYGVKA